MPEIISESGSTLRYEEPVGKFGVGKSAQEFWLLDGEIMTPEVLADKVEFEEADDLGELVIDTKATRKNIADAIRAAVAEEREACAKLAESSYHEECGRQRGLPEIHAAIRARST